MLSVNATCVFKVRITGTRRQCTGGVATVGDLTYKGDGEP